MTSFGWNYPPGVTGNEYAIAGPDYEQEADEPCPECGESMMEQGYRRERWVSCLECAYTNNLEPRGKEEWENGDYF